MPSTIASLGLQADPYVIAGFLDVTRFGAVGDGKADDTAAFQAALDAAAQDASGNIGASMVVYVPPGTYLVSNTITGYEIVADAEYQTGNQNYGTITNYGILAPTLVGNPASRPTIVLKDNVFTDPNDPQPVVHFVNTPNAGPNGCGGQWAGNAAVGCFDILFNAVVRDINVTTGNNPGAIGVQFYSAQYSYMQNVKVDATGGYAGIQGAPATSVWVNIEVDGGSYGVMLDHTAGVSAIVGLSLENQAIAGVNLGPKQVGDISITGFIIHETSPDATGILTSNPIGQGETVSLIDGVISTSSTSQPAISNPGENSLYINNTYLQGTASGQLIVNGSSTSVPATGESQLIDEYAHADPSTNPPVTDTDNQNPGYALTCYIVLNDTKQQTDYGPIFGSGTAPNDLVWRHIPMHLPWPFDPNTAWATDFGADPTGFTDSTVAIQAAIDAAHANGSEEVFLPRGDYSISATLKLYPNTKFFGPPGGFAQLTGYGWVTNYQLQAYMQVGDAESDAAATAAGTAIVSDIAFVLPTDTMGAKAPYDLLLPDGGANYDITDQTYLTAIVWQTGSKSILNEVSAVFTYYNPETVASPSRNIIQVDHSGGGRWYGLQAGGDGFNGSSGHMLYVTGNTSPLTLYGSNIEHAMGSSFYGFSNASNVRLLGLKTEEGSAPSFVDVESSNNIMVSGVNGDGPTQILSYNSTNVNFNTLAYYSVYLASGAGGTGYVTDDTATYTFSDAYALFEIGKFDNSAFPTCSTDLDCCP